MPSIRPSTWAGTPATMSAGGVPSRAGQLRRTRSWLPPMPPEVTTTAWARELEVPDRRLAAGRARRAPRRGRQHPAAHAVDGAALGHQLVDPVAEPQGHQPRATASRTRRTNGSTHARAGAPGDVEAGHRVAVPRRRARRRARPSRRPGRTGRPARAARPASRRRRSRRRPRPTRGASGPRRPVEPAVPSQSCQARSRQSLTPSRRCSGESTRNSPPKRPERLPAEGLLPAPGRPG